MRRIFIIAILAMMALHAVALEVTIKAGDLKKEVKDLTITSLLVTGTMDASDFYFIADNLKQLESLDLAGVAVVPCQLSTVRYFKNEFDGDELPVAALADMNNLTSVVLPRGVKVIDKCAFAGCDRLTAITLPTVLETIGEYAFAGCSALQEVTLPAAVAEVGKGAFMRCTALERLTVDPMSRLTNLGDVALMDCPALTHIDLGQSLRSVGERAFAGTGLQELDLTSSPKVESLGDWLMVLTPVERAKLPASLTHMGNGLFLYDTNLTAIDWSSKLSSVSDYLFAGTALADSLSLPPVATVGNFAFYNVSTLTYVALPATLTFMGDRAMAGMTGLTALSCFASNVPDLGDEVWAGLNQSEIPLDIPPSARLRYQAADQWKEFLFKDYGVRGDVNGDGEVNIADVNTLIDIVLTDGKGYNADILARADVNMDGEVNVADINAVIAIVLS